MTHESEKPAVQPSLFAFRANTRLVVGEGSIAKLGAVAKELHGKRALIVSDAGVLAAGHTNAGVASLKASGLETTVFSEFTENPTTLQVETGTAFAKAFTAQTRHCLTASTPSVRPMQTPNASCL